MYGKILVPVDGSAASMRGLAESIKVAKALGSKIRLMHAIDELVVVAAPTLSLYSGDLVESLRRAGTEVLDGAIREVRANALEPEHILIDSTGARAADVIVAQAREWPADLIVMGTHGRRGLKRLAMGSDAELVLRGSPVPVLMVKG